MSIIDVLLDTSDFPARWTCGIWSRPHGWTHIVSDIAIFGAYAAIPVALGYFILRRRDMPFLPIFWLFAAFILFCGLSHLIEATLFWHPWYRLSATVKLCTAIVSWITVLALIPALPRALQYPGLATVNARLEAEMEERGEAERTLREYAENLEAANLELRQFSDQVVDREDRVIELKRELNVLLARLGEPPRYGVDE